MSKELRKYIETALSKGAGKELLTETLTGAGWANDVVNKILSEYSGVDSLGIPVPAPKNQAHHLAKDLFVYFIIFITLSMASFAIGAIFFNLIDRFFSENLITSRYKYTNISWAIAQLIISFPVLTGLSWWIKRNLLIHPEKRESFVRKLMIYLILTITSIVCISDLIIVLTAFLQGELTLTFILNSVTVLTIAGIIFAYYFNEVKEDDRLIRTIKT